MYERSLGWLATVLCLVLPCLSCRTATSEEGKLVALDGTVLFEIADADADYVTAGDPALALHLTTDWIYPCCNYSIRADADSRSGGLDVSVYGVYEPEICLTATGPATFRSFPRLNPGRYGLRFLSPKGPDHFVVEITEDAVRISPLRGRLFHCRDPLVWRRPKNSFYLLCGTTERDQWMVRDFLDSLSAFPGLHEFSFPDSGSIPYPDSMGGCYVNLPARYFRYDGDSDFAAAGEFLRRYSRRVVPRDQGTLLSMVNWRNERVYSWYPPFTP